VAAIFGQPSAKPSQLSKPIPGQDEALSVDAMMAELDAPEIQPQAPQSSSPVDDMMAGLESGATGSFDAQSADQAQAPGDEQFAEEPGFVEANVGQLQNFVTRLQAGLAANPTEKANFMKKKFGPENVTEKDDNIYFRKAKKDKFKKLDPDTFEVINDIIPDFAREIITEASMVPGEVMGAAVGSAAGGPGIGTVGGAIAGRAASVPFANATADKAAELAGVPQDESRNKYNENLIGIGAEAVLPVVGKQILKRIPGTSAAGLAYKASREAGDRNIIALSKQDKELAKSLEILNYDGRLAKLDGEIVGFPGADITLMGHQLVEGHPDLVQFANLSRSSPVFRNAQQKIAENVSDTVTNTLEEIGRRNNKGPYRPEFLASKVTNAVRDLEKAEGEALGKYRSKAMATLKNAKQPLPQEAQLKIKGLMTELGFQMKSEGGEMKIIAPKDMNKLVGRMGFTTTGEARAVVNNLTELSAGLKKGLTLDDIDRLRNSTGSTSSALARIDAGAKMGQLSGDLRQMYRDVVSKGLDNNFDKSAFNAAMDDFSQLKSNIGTIRSALNEDASAKAVVASIFTGKENLAKVQKLKQISPESFASLKEEWVSQRLSEFADTSSPTGLNSKNFLKSINSKYGDTFMKEVVNDGPGANLETLKAALTVAERVESTFKGVAIDKLSDSQTKGAVNMLVGFAAKSPSRLMSGLAQIIGRPGAEESALMQILTRDGIDQYVANYPGKIDKQATWKKLNDFMGNYKLIKAAESYGPRPVKAAIKQKLQE